MKIKTITCHDVYNAGASLQAYALYKYLTDIGNQVEIIDYKPDYLSRHYTLSYVFNPKYNKPIIKQLYLILKFPGRFARLLSKRKREYDKFTALLPLTERYSSNETLKKDPPLADVYFAGSDQIWNTTFQNGKDPAFYLDFVTGDAKRASYAASFATEDVVDEYKSDVKKWLSNLDYISVREKSGVDIIKNLGINGAQTVLDPVFLLNADKWIDIAEKIIFNEPYILVYDFDKSDIVKSISLDVAKKNNFKIYSIQKNDYADKCFWNRGPAAFVSLIKNADFVISNSFHATAFSLIFNKQFVVVNRKEKINTRMADLLKTFSLENQMINSIQSNIDIIDYSLVIPKINTEITKSKDFILKVLNE